MRNVFVIILTTLCYLTTTVHTTAQTSGQCTWTLTGSTLTISPGSIGGEMADYNNFFDVPWYGSRGVITNLVINEGVTGIGKRAFYDCAAITGTLTLPQTLTSIRDSAFMNCDGISGTLTIPNSVTSIGGYAFDRCIGLTGLVLSNKLQRIGTRAFSRCTLLAGTVTIPASVNAIEVLAFGMCMFLTDIDVDPGNPVYASIDGVLFNKDCTVLESYPGGKKSDNYTIPNSVITIGDCGFFQTTHLDFLTIPASVTLIGDSAFHGSNVDEMIVKAYTPPAVIQYTFSGFFDEMDIYVPCGTKTAYENAEGWKDHKIQLQGERPYTLTLLVNDATKGDATFVQEPKCENNNTAIIKAAPKQSYVFKGWNDGVMQNPRTVVLTRDTTITAIFADPPAAFIDDLWYWGTGSPGLRFEKDENGNYEPKDASGESSVVTNENTLVVSSPYCEGKLIFYSSHNQLYNSLHEKMKNGLFAGHQSVADGLAACYMGDNKYLFFSVTNAYGASRGLMAYVVDMNGDNGNGERTTTEITIEPAVAAMSETVELIAKAGTTDQYWLLYAHCDGTCNSYYGNAVRVRSVDVSDPNDPKIESTFKSFSKTTEVPHGMKASQQHNRIAITNYFNRTVDVFKFDNITGDLSDLHTIPTTGSSGYGYGVEFSPDGNQLYIAIEGGSLHQYDISKTTPEFVTSLGPSGDMGLKLGPDHKIYTARSGTKTLGVISEPNSKTALSSRTTFLLNVTYTGVQLSTGLTPPDVISSNNANSAPQTLDDVARFYLSENVRSATVNVLANDVDTDPGNIVFLTSANFIHDSDKALADIDVSPEDSTITLTVRPGAPIEKDHAFEIIYDVKDNGAPASQCATGMLTITVDPLQALDDIFTLSCDDMPASLDVLKNDTLFAGCTQPVIRIVTPPAHATATFDDATGRIRYTGTLSGIDEFVYRVVCGTDSAEARAQITVNPSVSAFVDDVWYFGQNLAKSAGIRFKDDGSGNYVPEDASGESSVNSWENSLVVSSPYCEGQLIFYASHNQLFNSQHQLMENGTFSGNTSVADGFAACYMGDNKYLFFTVTDIYPNRKGLYAYVVDMNAADGKGALLSSTPIIVEPLHYMMSESVELIPRAGTTHQYWLLYAHHSDSDTDPSDGSNSGNYNNEIRVRLVDVSDPNNPKVETSTIHDRITKTTSRTFTLSASQAYNRVAIASFREKTVDYYDFDYATGDISNHRTLTGFLPTVYGVEFSPDGNQLYVSEYETVNAQVWQYDISKTPAEEVAGSPLQYWSQTTYNVKGSGLKLGPDGKIYVTQSYTTQVGAISDPNNATKPLNERYVIDALQLTKLGSAKYDALQFSEGLTRPAVMACNMNNPPVPQDDDTVLCAAQEKIAVNVLRNDTDEDGDKVSLTGAAFVDEADKALAELEVSTSDSTIILRLKDPGAFTDCHTFKIHYDVKDDGLPASQCATDALLTIHTYPTPDAPPTINRTFCYDGNPHVIVIPVWGMPDCDPDMPDPEMKLVWYTTATGNTETVAPTLTDEGTLTAYAAFRNTATGCESARTAATITVVKRPDLRFDTSQASRVDDNILFDVCIKNEGYAPISNLPVSFYNDDVTTGDCLATVIIADAIRAESDTCLTLTVDTAVIRPYLPFARIVARLNDDGSATFPALPECDASDNTLSLFNPALDLVMTKHARIIRNNVTIIEHDGLYANPVTVLYGDTVEYRIEAVNPTIGQDVIIRDTLPLYMKYTETQFAPQMEVGTPVTVSSGQYALSWKLTDVTRTTPRQVTFRSTPEQGANASQPLYINRAWVDVSVDGTGTTRGAVPTKNGVYHQGGGTSVVTFSASAGGTLYNPEPQAVDYSTSPRAGVLIVPNEGYVFAGWSHDEYYTPRGEVVPPAAGIRHYDSLTIYGNVHLRAHFAPNRYPILYYLHAGENAPTNPPSYTIEDAAITLAPPSKENDEFIGWTGSNGDTPQPTVTIPPRSTGERIYYANYLSSGREVVVPPAEEGDKVWAAGNEAYIRTTHAGSIVRVYTPDGALRRQHTILAPGLTKLRLDSGIYIITLNNSTGWKVVVSG